MLEWGEPKTADQVEAEEFDRGSEKPFGFLNTQWESLKAKMLPGDEIRRFSTDEASWRTLGGRMGVALIRNGEVVDEIITMFN